MEITQHLWSKWSPFMSYGDAKRIVDKWDAQDGPAPHINTVRRAFKMRKCSDKVFAGISRFYKAKMEVADV